MRSLEEIARDSFIDYSEKKLNKKVPWNKLSHNRQADWMDESHFLLQYLLDEIRKEVDIPSSGKIPQASYDAGVQDGTERERHRVRVVINTIQDKYMRDLVKFIKE